MKLQRSFYRLPLRFDVQRLSDEVAQFSEAEWRPHPQGHRGNSAIPLLAAYGNPDNEDTRGPMLPTPHSARLPYLRQALAALNVPLGRTRLMRIAGGEEATPHVDTNYYWAQRVRIHIPIVTYPGVRFQCSDEEVFMDRGECWIFDTWRRHNVINPDDRPRIHLVADTVGSASFWSLVEQVHTGVLLGTPVEQEHVLAFEPMRQVQLATEAHNFPVVMSPWEARWLLDHILDDLPPTADAGACGLLRARFSAFLQRWQGLWARFAESPEGWPEFKAELGQFADELAPLRNTLRLINGTDPVVAAQHWVVRAAHNPDLAAQTASDSPPETIAAAPVPGSPVAIAPKPSLFERPVFIVAAPRSGSSLLFETLARVPGLYTVGGESHRIIEGIPQLTPAAHGYHSNQLSEVDATPDVITQLHAGFRAALRDYNTVPPQEGMAVRMLEKTPKNAVRIPFLAAAFPDAQFIYLYREPRASLASIIEAWQSGRFVTYPHLPDWQGLPWSLLLTPGWRTLNPEALPEIAAAQWQVANTAILDALAALPQERWTALSYDDFVARPQEHVQRLCQFAGLEWNESIGDELPLSRHTLTPPNPDKWQAHAAALQPVLSVLEPTAARANAICQQGQPQQPLAHRQQAVAEATVPVPPVALGSLHTASFPSLLSHLNASLFVSTYQSGRVVLFRAQGDTLNTHFRNFNKPMGLALDGQRLAIGTEIEIRQFTNVPATAARLTPADAHDSCFVPRSVHTTGNIQIHEMAWAGDDLWFVNTRFSCLCTYQSHASFIPRWKPSFISALAPEDRCHLNGMALVDHRPRFVTALAAADTRQGWRDHKRDGGVVIDVEHDEIILRGLSMPHSPRWYNGQLWVLNSGQGGLGVVDPASERYTEVARMPGFTRGLDFCGRYAFVGLSQVRESAVFSGIAIAQMPVEQRACGIWVVDIVSGQTVGWVRFADAVQEIFAVQVAAGLRFPELITDDHDLIASTFVIPDEALDLIPLSLR